MSGRNSAEYYRRWRQTSQTYHHRTLLHGAKARARRLGVPFSLTLDDIPVPEVCPVLGIALKHQRGGRQSDSSPTVDRIVPERGYVPGNVVVVSFRANRIKNDASPEELQTIARFYAELTSDKDP